MSKAQRAGRKQKRPGSKAPVADGADFADQTENWFAGADDMIAEAESGTLPAERGGGYLEEPSWPRVFNRYTALALAGAVVVAIAIVWAIA